MQNRRNTNQLAHALEALAAVFSSVEIHEAGLGRSLCRTAGDDDDDIVLEKLLHELDVRSIGANLGVVAADHCDSTAQDAGLDNVGQRLQRAERVNMGVAHAVEFFLNGLDRVADAGLGLEVRNVDKFGLAVFEVFNRHADDRLGVLRRSILMELDEIRVRHAGNGRGRDELGMEALGKRAKSREDALHINDDGFACARQDNVFLLQEVTCHRNALPHGDLVAGAADARDVDALCADGLGQRDHLGILRIHDDHLGKRRIVAVDDDVDHVLFHDADVGGGVNGARGAEQNVGQLGAGHGAAPAVGQASAQGLLDERLGKRRTAHMRHMQRLRNLAVNGTRLDASVMPQLLGMLGRTLQKALHAERLAVLEKGGFSNFVGQIINILALGLDTPFGSNFLQFFGVFDLIRAAFLRLIERVADLTAMVGVRSSTTCGEAQVVAADDAVYVAAANAARCLGRNAAGAHGANAAAGAGFAEAAVRRLILDALLPGIRANFFAGFKQFVGRCFHLFNCD